MVKLREGVTFHDGVAFDADVAKDFLDAARTDARQLRDHPALGDIETIEVLWVDLLRIQLRQPTPFLLDDLAIRIERPVDGRLTGTGPFARQDPARGCLHLGSEPHVLPRSPFDRSGQRQDLSHRQNGMGRDDAR